MSGNELFSITCTTCKSRLKVRDQAAVGQILACPKCGGMVMIKPPPVWDESTEQKSDLPTATEIVGAPAGFNQTLDSSAFDVVGELLSDSPPKMQPPPSFTPPPAAAPAATPKPRFVGGPVVPPPVAPAKIVANQLPTATHDSGGLSPPPPGETAAAPPSKAASSSTLRYWTFMAGSIVLGILLAFGAVTMAMFLVGPAKPARNATTARPSSPSHSDVPPSEASSNGAFANSPAPLESSSAPQESTAPRADASATAATVAVAPQADPLGLVKTPPAPAPAEAALGDPLGKFERLIGGAGDDPLARPEKAPDKPTSLPSDSGPVRPLAPRPPPREVDVAKRLADSIPAIQTAGTPLADFLQLMSDLSTIPITLEPDALPLVKATVSSPVILQANNTTVGGALTQALTRLNLEWVETDGQLIVAVVEPAELRTYAYPMKDLAADAESMAELAETLQALVEPPSWGDQPGQGEIQIDEAKAAMKIRQRQNVHAILVFLCEKLRTARGKPHASARFDPALFSLESRTAKARPRLEATVSLNYRQPTRLVTILNRLGEAAGVRIVVDWHSVALAGWNPAGEATLVASKQPLSAALDALLDPLDLTWRAVDGQTLQVVTPSRLAEQCEVELYKVDDSIMSDASGDELLAKVRAALGEATFRIGGGNGELHYDAEGKCLLAWLPQPKQRELEGLLAKWQADKGK